MNLTRLNELVKESKLTKKQFAGRCGITRVTLDNALQGGDIRVSILEKLANALNINVGELFDNSVTGKACTAIVNGDHFAVAINGNTTVSDIVVLEERVRSLEAQTKQKDLLLDEKERLLGEKERLIQVLLKSRE